MEYIPMQKKYVLILSMFLFCTSLLYAPKIEHVLSDAFSTHGILFFIDSSEENDGAATKQLARAVYSEAVPIFVSATLWHSFLSFFDTKYQLRAWKSYSINEYFYLLIPKKYIKKLPPTKKTDFFTEEETRTGLKISLFKQLDDAFMLQEKNFPSSSDFARKYPNPSQQLSQEFLKLFAHETKKNITVPVQKQSNNSMEIELKQKTIVTKESTLFISNQEYAQAGIPEYIPQTAAVMLGHGKKQVSLHQEIMALTEDHNNPIRALSNKQKKELKKSSPEKQKAIVDEHKKQIYKKIKKLIIKKKKGSTVYRDGLIAGVVIQDLKEVLQFFNDHLSMPLVMIISCYAAGTNTQELLKNTVSPELLMPHKFFLLSGALTTGAVSVYSNYLYSFNKFFSELRKPLPIDFAQTASNIHTFYDAEAYDENYNNFLMIKPPGLTWMQHSHIPGKIASIGSAMTGRTNELDIATFFSETKKPQTPSLLLLSTNTIPFPLKLSGKDMPAIISMTPGDSIVEIKKFDAAHIPLSSFIDAFFKVRSLADFKIFNIATLTTKDYPELKDVVIANIPARSSDKKIIKYVFFTEMKNDKEILWEADITERSLEKALKTTETQEYKKLLLKSITNVPQLGSPNLAFQKIKQLETELLPVFKETLAKSGKEQ